MNKRVPLLLSLIGVIALAASIAYWFLQLYQPPQRPIAAVPVAQMPDPAIDAAATLFGGQVAVASATNYQLTGVVAAGRNSVAIIVADGSPPKALKVGKEVAPGVTLAEVYPRYVMLSDGGVMKRIDLATDNKAAAPMGGAPGGAPIGVPSEAGSAAPIMPPPATPAPIAPNAPVGNAEVEPPLAPGAVSQQTMVTNPTETAPPPANPNAAPITPGAAPANPNAAPANPNAAPINPAPAPVQMAPPTRPVGSSVNPSPVSR